MTSSVVHLASEIHDELLKLITPASPASIKASSLHPRRNLALFCILLFSLGSLVIFIAPILITISVSRERLTDLRELNDLLRIVGGAGLGSAFYALYTARSYIEKSTFDPKYSTTYLLRFFIGLLSGLILAYFLREILLSVPPGQTPPSGSPTNNGAATANAGNAGSFVDVRSIGVAALALIGGYAAEAVARILDRVSETLVTLVSGSDKDKVEAERQRAAAEMDKRTAQLTSETVQQLQQALTEADVKSAVQNVMSKILSRK